ncbi:hypothetical protein BDZ89DRAFT_1048268 [Hymenopellis radicata]|nr:hypothetical protein BDZ89DRAFT_1048268 [Hymenopellis radicata]
MRVRRLLSYLSLPENVHMYFWGCPALGANDGDIANLIPTNLNNLPCMLGWRSGVSAVHHKVLYTLDIGSEAHIARMATVYAPVLRNVRQVPVRTGLKSMLGLDGILCPELKKLSFEVASTVQGPGFYISTFINERKPPPPLPPPPVVTPIGPPAQEQTSLEMESMRVASAS